MIGAAAIHSIEVWLVALIVTVAVLAAFGVFARWCALSPAVRQSKLDQVHVGMTTSEVTAILGTARQMRTSDDGRRTWLYGSAMKRHVLVIEFNGHGHLESFAHGVPHNTKRPPPPGANV